ncbi:thiol:disulfide interchange protein [Brasilonema octagenarum UFV-E1]|uniref:Thiol:disulfide interchange protein n=1 Tax=Brasilonema sennae CENA114 TaxID=415709 RepID=A0A856ML54_9CYAN|nr:thioredoxin family protein [Brasilonema sennae]QDL11099.1 thiol:disulfide interchange protein [Brasilonema sennae CENA114]QDL17444.1 thiol:disulfide interchange protein [Brasilonema octagenarum UFV-E1]
MHKLTQIAIKIITFILSFLVLLPLTAWANPVKTEHVQTHLVSEVNSIQPGKPFWVGLHFQIKQGWHTYWKNPGDSGAAPSIAWKLPQGFSAGELVYPYPERLPASGLMNFGYKDEVMLLSQITTPGTVNTKEPIQLTARADWLVCEKECIPENGTFSLSLPIATGTPTVNTRWAKEFEKTRATLPQDSPWQTTAHIQGETLILKVNAPQLQASQIKEVAFFPDQDGIINNPAPQKASFDKDGLTLLLERGNRGEVNQVTGILVLQEVLDRQTPTQAFAIATQLGAATTTQPATTASLPLWQVLGLALLGGIVLNLMPCVFPVLSLKALNVLQKSNFSKQEVRQRGIVFTAGVLISFLFLAVILLVLRSFGQQIGWGFQLQSPVFVSLMAYLLFAVGLSLSGVFIFGASLMGMGQTLAARNGLWGEFFTGVFATVVATPCTAPFMATAIGVALTQTPIVALAIFLVLGFGLALPYLLISFLPGLQKILPRPGAWMETFAQLLAFPMYAATAWLVWVLSQQAGSDGVAAVLFGLVLISFAVWLHQKTQIISGWRRRFGSIAALVVLGFALALAQLPGSIAPNVANSNTQQATSTSLNWQPYTPERLTQVRQSGKPVFVNFSAAWCITCLVNERVALNQPETVTAFQAKDVALLKADWTNRDTAITQALAAFGRSGVPLYLLYPANSATPQILPQILSPQEVQQKVKSL